MPPFIPEITIHPISFTIHNNAYAMYNRIKVRRKYHPKLEPVKSEINTHLQQS